MSCPEIDHSSKSHAELSKLYNFLIYDTCDTDTKIRDLAWQVLSNAFIDGDSYGVPAILVQLGGINVIG